MLFSERQEDLMSDSTFRSDAGGGARDKIREKAAGLADGAKDAARSQYQRAMSSVVGELNSLAGALRGAGEHIQSQNQSQLAITITGRIADRITSFADTLDGRDFEEVMDNVNAFARRNPAAFLGGAAAIGFFAARFVKSSATAALQSASMRTTPNASVERPRSAEPAFNTGIPSAYGTGSSASSYGTGAPASEYGTGSTGSGMGPGSTSGRNQ
jgi:ribosomal protein L12E/L44/L45/RPP1/RPP2